MSTFSMWLIINCVKSTINSLIAFMESHVRSVSSLRDTYVVAHILYLNQLFQYVSNKTF